MFCIVTVDRGCVCNCQLDETVVNIRLNILNVKFTIQHDKVNEGRLCNAMSRSFISITYLEEVIQTYLFYKPANYT